MHKKLKSVSVLMLILVLFMNCKEGRSKKAKIDKKETSMETVALNTLLYERASASEKKFSKEKNKIYAEGIEDVESSGVLENALKVGDKAPDFKLNDALNNPVSLYDELKKGPVILTWYRGGWCPYCNITLHYLQEKLPKFKKEGATLIALTPELPDKSLTTSEKHNLEFTVLSDVGNKIGKNYGVVFELTNDVASIYEDAFGLHQNNGDSTNELPLAATYVIDSKGVIQYAFLDADYKKRAEPNTIIKALKGL